MSEQINETYFAWLNKRIDKYEPPSREEVWNAATAEANKRIEALEARHERDISEYTAMREALDGLIKTKQYKDANGKDITYELMRITSWHKAEQAISTTPAESLAKRDDEVIEKCAKVCIDIQPDYVDNSVYHECANAIRALKEVK